MNLEIARQIAEKVHVGQKQKNGEPYINHAIRVSEMAAEYSGDAAIVGMLHDVIEDSDVTIGDLVREGFSLSITSALCWVTHLKGIYYIDYILAIKDNELAREVKICDLKDNLNGATGTLRDKYQMAYYILTGDIL
jgi:(p)ppGpp synthase/HD superfamily hydrolase